MNKPQIIYDKKRPAFVVLPIEDFLALSSQAEAMMSDVELFDMAMAEDDGVHVPHDVVKRIIGGDNSIKVYREWRSISQRELSDKTGVSTGYISQIERGVRHPSRKMQMVFAKALGVNAADLD